MGYWENLEEGEEEGEDERKKEGKKKSRGSIDRLSDRFLTFPFSFSFSSSLSLLMFFQYFSLWRKKTITHHSASRSHLASKHISSSLSPPQGTLRTSNSRNQPRNIFLLLLLGARGRERGRERTNKES